MKKALIMTLALLCLPLLASAQSFTTTLSGSAEVPGPGDADGVGIAVVSIDGTMIDYTLLVQNIGTPTAAHIHTGAAGTSGDVVVNLNPSFNGGNATGTVSADPAVIDQILANPAGFYVNVHNAEFPNGAIRGQLGPAGSTALYVPIVGNVTGLNGTKFITDLRIINSGDEAVQANIELYPASGSGVSSPSASTVVTVAPGEQKVLNDVTGTTLGVPEKIGAMRIVANGDVRADVRILNDNRAINQGTAGFYIRGVDASAATTSGLVPLLSQASQADRDAKLGFRTNIGYFNPHSTSTGVTFEVHRSSDGQVLGSKTLTLGGLQQQQAAVFGLIDSLSGQAIEDFYITWTSSQPIMVYAAVVDNMTGDTQYIQ